MGREWKKIHSQNSGMGREWKKPIPIIREREGNEKKAFPKFGNGKGMKKSIPIIWERESEAFILGNGRERESPLTPGLLTQSIFFLGLPSLKQLKKVAFSSRLHKLRLRAIPSGNCNQFTCRLHLFEKNGLSFWKPASRTNISSWCEESWIGLSSRADFNLFPQLHSWASQSQTDRLRPPPLLTPKVQQWQITVIQHQPQAGPWWCSNLAKSGMI